MATRKPLFIDSEGFPTEMDPNYDDLQVESLQVQGTVGITMVSGTVTGLPNPTADDEAANKAYVDSVAQGLTPKQAVRVTTSGVDLTDHVGGSGATFAAGGGAGGTGQFTSAPDPINDVSLAEGDRILVKDEGGGASHIRNGIYVVTSTTTTWDRASDFDEDSEALAGSCVFVTEGTVYSDTVWCVITDDPITLNTTAIEWSQFSGAAGITAGDGLTKTGDTLDVGGGAGIVANTNDVAVELDTAADAQGAGADGGTSGLEFDVTGVDGLLRVRVNEAGGVQRGSSGLELELDDTPNTLDVDTDGLKVVGLPINFLIDDVTTSGTVTAANLNELTLGGTTTLHTHAGVSEAETVQNSYTTDGTGVTAGDPVYVSADDVVSSADASANNTRRYIGIARTTVGASTSVDIVSAGVVTGLTVAGSPAAGVIVYLDVGGGLTTVRPTSSGEHVLVIGKMKNGTDLHIEPQYLGKNT